MRIAVLMPFFNAEATIKRAVESISRQTYLKKGELQAFFVDNASFDDSACRILDIRTPFPFEILDCPTKGIVPALNTGLFKILGQGGFDAVARLDADDIWENDKLEKQVSFLRKNEDVSILGTQLRAFRNDPNEEVPYISHPTEHKDIVAGLYRMGNTIAHPSVMVRTEVYKMSGVYDAIYDQAEDYQFWMKASLHFKFANLPDKLVRYHLSDKSYGMGGELCKRYYGTAIAFGNKTCCL